jgi:hypothetical protein
MVKFNYQIMLFRMLTLAYTTFGVVFFKDLGANLLNLLPTPFDITQVLQNSASYALSGAFAGFGLDQLLYRMSKDRTD